MNNISQIPCYQVFLDRKAIEIHGLKAANATLREQVRVLREALSELLATACDDSEQRFESAMGACYAALEATK